VINAQKHQQSLFVHQIGQVHKQMDDQDRLVERLEEQNAWMERKLEEVTEELEA